MPTIEHEISVNKTVIGMREHVARHKVAYSFWSGVAVTGIACLIFRGRPGVTVNVPIILPPFAGYSQIKPPL